MKPLQCLFWVFYKRYRENWTQNEAEIFLNNTDMWHATTSIVWTWVNNLGASWSRYSVFFSVFFKCYSESWTQNETEIFFNNTVRWYAIITKWLTGASNMEASRSRNSAFFGICLALYWNLDPKGSRYIFQQRSSMTCDYNWIIIWKLIIWRPFWSHYSAFMWYFSL